MRRHEILERRNAKTEQVKLSQVPDDAVWITESGRREIITSYEKDVASGDGWVIYTKSGKQYGGFSPRSILTIEKKNAKIEKRNNNYSYATGQRVYATGESDVPKGTKGIIKDIGSDGAEETYIIQWEGYGREHCREVDFKV